MVTGVRQLLERLTHAHAEEMAGLGQIWTSGTVEESHMV